MDKLISEGNNEKSILFLDSGIGGISVLKEALKVLPNENYVFFGDTKNAPYGDKSSDELKEITLNNLKKLLTDDIKAVVIACNTITGVAVDVLRHNYQHIPILGVEPALKPATQENLEGDIWVMATDRTLKEEKFSRLLASYGKDRSVYNIPCTGLMEYAEKGIFEGEEIEAFLREIFEREIKDFTERIPKAIVLGCTHYPFLKKAIRNTLGENVSIYDGGIGTAKYLKLVLWSKGLLSARNERGTVKFLSSGLNDDFSKKAEGLLK